MSNFNVTDVTSNVIDTLTSTKSPTPELAGIPSDTRMSIIQPTYEESVNLICDKLRQDLLTPGVERSHLSWATCNENGNVNIQSFGNNTECPAATAFVGASVSIPFKGVEDARDVYFRLVDAMNIQAITTEVEPSKIDVFDLYVGHEDTSSVFAQVVPGKDGYTEEQRMLMGENKLGNPPWLTDFEEKH